ncbi:hypothetical protein KAU33_16665 [Candidatus Dependentiae bacterium]|nr:hypothetical protein [Candidatus Dependentiae bacterium]
MKHLGLIIILIFIVFNFSGCNKIENKWETDWQITKNELEKIYENHDYSKGKELLNQLSKKYSEYPEKTTLINEEKSLLKKLEIEWKWKQSFTSTNEKVSTLISKNNYKDALYLYKELEKEYSSDKEKFKIIAEKKKPIVEKKWEVEIKKHDSEINRLKKEGNYRTAINMTKELSFEYQEYENKRKIINSKFKELINDYEKFKKEKRRYDNDIFITILGKRKKLKDCIITGVKRDMTYKMTAYMVEKNLSTINITKQIYPESEYYFINVLYYDEEYLYIQPGKTLIILIDDNSEGISFKTYSGSSSDGDFPGSRKKATLGGTVEKANYIAHPYDLKNLEDARKIRVKIIGKNKNEVTFYLSKDNVKILNYFSRYYTD